MGFTKQITPLAISVAMAFGISSQASASIYSGSRLLFEDIIIGVNNTNGGGDAVNTFQFTTIATSSLNGTDASGALEGTNQCNQDSCANVTPVLESVASIGPTQVRGTGDYDFFGPLHNIESYAGSAAEISNAALIDGNPTDTRQISEVEVSGNGNAAADTTISSETSLSFEFTNVIDGGFVFVQFLADPNIFIEADTTDLESFVASAETTSQFVLTGTNGENVQWESNGRTVGNQLDDFDACSGTTITFSCTELMDSEDLNQLFTLPFGNPINRGTSDNRVTQLAPSADQGLQLYQFSISGLSQGDYSITLNSGTTTTVTQSVNVPEPNSLALIGLSLAGLGFAKRKK